MILNDHLHNIKSLIEDFKVETDYLKLKILKGKIIDAIIIANPTDRPISQIKRKADFIDIILEKNISKYLFKMKIKKNMDLDYLYSTLPFFIE